MTFANDNIKLAFKSITNSYSQIFFSNNTAFALLIMLVSFFDIYAGLGGLISVLVTNFTAYILGIDKYKIAQGYYGFNAFLVGTGLGLLYKPSVIFYGILIFAAVLTLIIAITTEGVIGKYALPNLSLPFVFSLWLVLIATKDFTALGVSERWLSSMDDLYSIGGKKLVDFYYYWNNADIPKAIKVYLFSLGAIVFQYNLLSGLLIAIGLLIYSRIAFSLSIIGFFTAFMFYNIIGVDISEVTYSYIGFNYILSSIAIGGFFLIPSWKTYSWTILLIPIVAILTISFSSVMYVFKLPSYALPFNFIVLSFLYTLKFRTRKIKGIQEVLIQQNNPEKNLYSYANYIKRFGNETSVDIELPFHGKWLVTQSYNGEITHKDYWKHALDFEIADENGNTFEGDGNKVDDYYCYNKNVIAPADGVIEEIKDGIYDNNIGEENLKDNWGNTVIIKHSEYIYSKLSHLKTGSIKVEKGQNVYKGDVIAKVGNSGRSPVPHLHFQMQASPYIGSATMNYPISSFVKINKTHKLLDYGIPEKNDEVENIEAVDAIKKAFYFKSGKILRFEKNNEIYKFEAKADIYGNQYLHCEKTNSFAYFKSSDKSLRFRYFTGDKNSLLYDFYLAAYKITTGVYENINIIDEYPVNSIYSLSLIRILQDFIAPFKIFLKTKFTLEFVKFSDDFVDTNIKIKSKAEKLLFGITKTIKAYEFELNETGLVKFIIKNNGTKEEVKCLKN